MATGFCYESGTNKDFLTVEELRQMIAEMQELGYNHRLTDMQCALGLSQLRRLDSFIARRREIVAAYNAAFSDIDCLQTPGLRTAAHAATTSWHLYSVQLDFSALGRTRSQVMAQLRTEGVGTQVLYILVHLPPWYREHYGYAPGKCPIAESFYSCALSLPLYPAMTDGDVESVIVAVQALEPIAAVCIIPARGGSKRIPQKISVRFSVDPFGPIPSRRHWLRTASRKSWS